MNLSMIKRIAGVVTCVVAGVMAIKDEYEDQQKEKRMEDLERRLTELEERSEKGA